MAQKNISTVIVIVIIIVISVISRPSVEKKLEKASKTMNKSLPKFLDQETRWDTTTSGPGRKLTYYYTLVNYALEDIDQADFSAKMRVSLVALMKKNPKRKVFQDYKVTFTHIYKDKNGKQAAAITVTPADYR